MNKAQDLRIDFNPDSAVAKLVDEEEVGRFWFALLSRNVGR